MEITKTSLVAQAVQAAATLHAGTGNDDAFKASVASIAGKLIESFDEDEAAVKRSTHLATGGGSSYRGGSGGGGGNRKAPTLEEAKATKFKGGKFPDLTIEEVAKMGASEASTKYDYNDQSGNPQAGISYIRWRAGLEGPKNNYMASRCKLVLEAIEGADKAAPASVTEETTEKTDSEFDFGGGSW